MKRYQTPAIVRQYRRALRAGMRSRAHYGMSLADFACRVHLHMPPSWCYRERP